jgi:hypothetical protein
MPVHETRRFVADCDECDWVSEPCDWEDQAATLLDQHIREKH